jgi:GDPmannose 4,6-dehydratase
VNTENASRQPPGPKRALIVGITGQDGAYLAKLLLDKGYEVIGTSRDAQPGRLQGLARLGIVDRIAVESMSPTDFRSAVEILSKWRPREVYNLSGQSSVALSFKQPVDAMNSIVNGTLTLLEVIRFLDRSIRFYSAGSSECFGNVESGLANEGTPFRPRSPYATAKAAAHWTVASYREGYDIFACTGILFNHESPLRPEQFVTRKISLAATRIASGTQEKLVLGNMDIRRDWGWAPEYVDAMWRMLQQSEPRDFVIATGRLSSLEEFVSAAFDAVGLEWRRYVTTDASLARPIDVAGFAGDSTRARESLEWRPSMLMPQIATLMVEGELDPSNVGPALAGA